MELTLIAIIVKIVVFDVEDFFFATPSVEVYITRFVASLLLHMELICDVKQGLLMLKYLNTHPEEFEGSLIPYLIALMQSTGGFLAECTNFLMMAKRETVEYCITFFVAFHVLSAIDNIYAHSLSGFSLHHVCKEPLVFKRQPKDIEFGSRSTLDKFMRAVCVVMTFCYNSFYYYFMPYIVNFIPYAKPGGLSAY